MFIQIRSRIADQSILVFFWSWWNSLISFWSFLLEQEIYMGQNTVMLHVGGGPKFFCQIFRLIPNSMFIIRWEIVIWGVRTTKKPQIWPYFGPKAYNEVNWRIWNIKFNLQLEEHFWVQIPSVIPFRNRLVIPNLEI